MVLLQIVMCANQANEYLCNYITINHCTVYQRNSYVKGSNCFLIETKNNYKTIMTFFPTLSQFDSAWGGKRRGTSRSVIE